MNAPLAAAAGGWAPPLLRHAAAPPCAVHPPPPRSRRGPPAVTYSLGFRKKGARLALPSRRPAAPAGAQGAASVQPPGPRNRAVRQSLRCRAMPAAVGGGCVWALRPTLQVSSAESCSSPRWASVPDAPPHPTALSASPHHVFVGDASGVVTAFAHPVGGEPSASVGRVLLPGGSGGVSAVCWVARRGVFAADVDGAVYCFDEPMAVGGGRREMLVHRVLDTGGGRRVVGALGADEHFLYVGADDGVVRVWELGRLVLERELALADAPVSCLLRAGPSTLWVGLGDGRVKVVDVFGDEECGVEVVAEDRPHRGAVTRLVHVSSEEVWSVSEGDQSPVAAWSVRLPALLGPADVYGQGKGAVQASVREIVELGREPVERVQFATLGGPALSDVSMASLTVPAVPPFSPVAGLGKHGSASLGGRNDADETLDGTVCDPPENVRGADGTPKTRPEWARRRSVSGEDWKPVGELYARASESARNLVQVRDTMDPAALGALFTSVARQYEAANTQLRRRRLSASPERRREHDREREVAAAASSHSSDRVRGGEGVTGTSAPLAPGLSASITDALAASLRRCKALLPSVRVGDMQGPLARELDAASEVLRLCIADFEAQVASADGGDTSARAAAASGVRQAAHVAAAAKAASLRDALEKSRQETTAAMSSLRDAKAQLLLTQMSGDRAATSLTVARAERDVLAQDLNDLQAESEMAVRALQRALNEHGASASSLRAEVGDLEAKLREESADRSKLEMELDAKLDVIESLEQAHRDAENALLDKTAELAASENNLDKECHLIASLRQSLDDSQDARRKSQDAFDAQSRELVATTARWEAALSNVALLEGALGDGKDELRTLEARLQALEQSSAAERLALAAEQSAHAESKAAANVVSASAVELRAALGAEREKRREAEDMLASQIPALDAFAKSVTERVGADAVEADSELQSALSAAEATAESLCAAEGRVAELEGAVEVRDDKVEAMEGQLAAAAQETLLLRQAVTAQHGELDASRSAYENLREAFDALRDDSERGERRSADVTASTSPTPPPPPPSSAPPSVSGTDDTVPMLYRQIEALERANANRESELRGLRDAVEAREITVAEAQARLVEAGDERDAAQRALEAQIDATATLAGLMSDRDDRCEGLESQVEQLRRERRESTATAAATGFDGSSEVTAALDESRRAMEDTRRTVESATLVAARLQECAATHRESLPILVELERELRRQHANLAAAPGSGGSLQPAINVLGSMIALLYSDANEKSALALEGGDEAAYFAPTPVRASALRSQVQSWRVLRGSDESAAPPDATPGRSGPSAATAHARREQPGAWTPRRLLRF
jgi:hypothetical protein